MFHVQRKILFHPRHYPSRSLWEWVNMMFNKPDPERIKSVGPNVACAEWVIKNGGAVRWSGDASTMNNFFALSDDTAGKTLEDIISIDSSISHYGFPHLKGCKNVKKIVLDQSSYIDDRALEALVFIDSPLKFLQISNCKSVTDEGLMKIPALQHLETLILLDLPQIKRMMLCQSYLENLLPKCKIITDRKELQE